MGPICQNLESKGVKGKIFKNKELLDPERRTSAFRSCKIKGVNFALILEVCALQISQ